MFGVIVHLLIAFGGNFASGFSPRSCQPVDENGSFQDIIFRGDSEGGRLKAICWPPSLFIRGFDANQIPLLECEDGSFLSRSIPACNPSGCPDIGDLSNTLLRTIDHGMTVEVFCHTSLDKFDWTSNFPDPDETLVCQDGHWTKAPPTCNDTFVSFKRGLRKLNRYRTKLPTPIMTTLSGRSESTTTTSILTTTCLKDCGAHFDPLLTIGLPLAGILIVAIPVITLLCKKIRKR